MKAKRHVILLVSILPWLACVNESRPDEQAGQHPSLIITKTEAREIRKSLGKYPLLDQSVDGLKATVEAALASLIEVPPPGEAGGYEHERHKQNYREMRDAGLLYQITGDERYAGFVRDMLMRYAEMYPTLGPHPRAHNQRPGKLFHQMLNETVWLANTSIAYDCIYEWLSPEDREHLEANIFRQIVEWFTETNVHEFDRIHNHGMWSTASVGMIGYVTGNQDWVDMALYGSERDGSGGFLKQVELLFSPDGYYMEGPYYVRYAMRPLFKFAEAIERNQPELEIYGFKDGLLKKALYSAANLAFPNGVFAPINDASKTMDIRAPGVVLGTNAIIHREGADDNLLALCAIQGRVFLNGAGLATARAYSRLKAPPKIRWGSIEYTDGNDGTQGGVGVLRHGEGADQTMVLMKYGVHGLGHGHFDKLHFILFDQGREVIPDYGFCRWINIEPKFGGRYLPENDSYAKQTITHNTVVVDGISQNRGDRQAADRVHGERHFFDATRPDVQVMSARANQHYDGVDMQRTLFLIANDQTEFPVLIDIYRLKSQNRHQYDYPIHYNGQLINFGSSYEAFQENWQPLGPEHGYQHIWKTAEGSEVTNSPVRLTWVDGHRYYTLITTGTAGGQGILGRTGANDPDYNLRSEPLAIVRANGSEVVFCSAIEPHGYFNEATESSRAARGIIQAVRILGHTDEGTVVNVTGKNGLDWTLSVTNQEASATRGHSVLVNGQPYEWSGNFSARLEGNNSQTQP
ncbi:MAG: alginate lyase family protein [Fidelibacterota bacterium]|nr:MAG: alginate lyase family protein [Candidatus Neomarinimicrobiota bacterium]